MTMTAKKRLEFLERVKRNAALKKEAKAKGQTINLKRQPVPTVPAHYVSAKNTSIITVAPVPYEGN